MTEYMEKQVLAALVALGTSAEQIAETLRAKGIKGELTRAGHCPVANYLNDKFLGWKFTTYGTTGGNSITGGHMEPVRNPAPVEDFIRLFDGGRFPDLIIPNTNRRPFNQIKKENKDETV